MSRNVKPNPKGPAVAKTADPAPAQALPQVTPDATDAVSAPASAAAEAAAASVDPKPDAAATSTPPETKAEAKAPKPKQPVVLRVKGPANGRWRAGRHFTSEPVDIPMDDLTDEDLQKLNGDPELTCTTVTTDA